MSRPEHRRQLESSMRHKEFAKHMLIFVGLVICSLSFVMAVPGIGEATTALGFDGIDAYVTFGSDIFTDP